MTDAGPRDSSAANPHCAQHPHFTAGCQPCNRAKAAFLPYKITGTPEPATRSFQHTAESLIVVEPGLSRADLVKVVAADAVTESIVDVVLNALFRS